MKTLDKIAQSIAESYSQAGDWFVLLPWYWQVLFSFLLTILAVRLILEVYSVVVCRKK